MSGFWVCSGPLLVGMEKPCLPEAFRPVLEGQVQLLQLLEAPAWPWSGATSLRFCGASVGLPLHSAKATWMTATRLQ